MLQTKRQRFLVKISLATPEFLPVGRTRANRRGCNELDSKPHRSALCLDCTTEWLTVFREISRSQFREAITPYSRRSNKFVRTAVGLFVAANVRTVGGER